MMRIVFFDKKKETYMAIENAHHLHIDYLKNKKVFVIYTEEEIKTVPFAHYELYKVDC